jgi:hypothetical protein
VKNYYGCQDYKKIQTSGYGGKNVRYKLELKVFTLENLWDYIMKYGTLSDHFLIKYINKID